MIVALVQIAGIRLVGIKDKVGRNKVSAQCINELNLAFLFFLDSRLRGNDGAYW
jgi:hypothetical protein